MTSLLPDAVAIGVGAVFGAYSRFHIGRLATEKIAQDPKRFGVYSGWHTAGINIAGSFILGIVSQAPVSKSTNIPGDMKQLEKSGNTWFQLLPTGQFN